MQDVLTGKKVLLIDDFAEFRFAIKRMIEQLGAKDIDMAANGEKASVQLAKKHYDLVLSDYNLGDGKDGQQVLEESRYYGHIGNSTVFMMVTAENTPEMVMGALEYQPDGYLAKPFNKDFLQTRLSKMFLKKKQLGPIHVALDNKEYEKVIQLCNLLLRKGTVYSVDCLRAKAEALMATRDYQKALGFFQQVVKQKKAPWAWLGVGRAQFHLGQYQEALTTFSNLLRFNEACTPAYDWQARTYAELNNLPEALKALQIAIKRSPKAILRQQSLAVLALKMDNFEVAERAARAAIRLGKNSCFQNAEDYYTFARLLVKRGKSSDNISAKRALQEALEVIKDGKSLQIVQERPDLMIRLSMIESIAQGTLGVHSDKKQELQRMRNLVDSLPDNFTTQDTCSISRELIETGEERYGLVLAGGVISKRVEDDDLVNELQKAFNGTGLENELNDIVNSEKVKLSQYNRQGMIYYEQGKLDEAVRAFEQALTDLPDNTAICLNYVQALLDHMDKSKQYTLEQLNKCEKALAKCSQIAESDASRYERYQPLKERFSEVKLKYAS